MKKRTRLLAVIGMIVLLTSILVYAEEDEEEGYQVFLEAELVKLVAKAWMVTTTLEFYYFLTDIFKYLPFLILANPTMDMLKPLQAFFIKLVQPYLILAIVLTAAYLLLYSESVKGRAKAKGVLMRLIFTMILISLSPFITWLMITAAHSIAAAILDQAGVETATNTIKEGTWSMFWIFAELTLIHRTGGVEMLLLWETFLLIFNFALAMRYLMVILWSTLLPFTLLLFSFSPTKSIGKKFLHQTFLWIFVQIGWALGVLVISSAAVGIVTVMPDFPASKIGIASLLVLIATPMMILGVMDWLSMGVEVVEIVNAAPLSMAALTIDEMKVEREVITEEEALEGV